MDRSVGRVGNGYRLCVLGDMKGWNGDRVRAGVTVAFVVPEENEKEKKGGALRWKGISVLATNTSNLRVAKGQDGVEVKSMIDLVLVKRI